MSSTVADVRSLIDKSALGADALLEVVLPRLAVAFRDDDLKRLVLTVDSQIGYGIERSEVWLNAEPVSAPCTDVTNVGELLAHVASARVPDSARIVVVVDGTWEVADIGVVRIFGRRPAIAHRQTRTGQLSVLLAKAM